MTSIEHNRWLFIEFLIDLIRFRKFWSAFRLQPHQHLIHWIGFNILLDLNNDADENTPKSAIIPLFCRSLKACSSKPPVFCRIPRNSPFSNFFLPWQLKLPLKKCKIASKLIGSLEQYCYEPKIFSNTLKKNVISLSSSFVELLTEYFLSSRTQVELITPNPK